MSSVAFHRVRRTVLLITVTLGCFVTLYFVYFKQSTTSLLVPKHSTASTDVVKSLSSNKSSQSKTTLLVWFWPFRKVHDLSTCSTRFNIEGCFFTADRNLYNKSDGVIIHHRDLMHNQSDLPPAQRPFFQKWIWMNMESPSNSLKLPGIENLFNLTLNYRQDADIEVHHSIVPREGDQDFVPRSKNMLLCWIVSNWKNRLTRVQYFNELHKHIKIQVYGEAFNSPLTWEEYISILSSCKFYLSFENSIHKDYITEKFYNPLSVGTVPVVLGPPRKNYENFIQGDAFIHVDDFSSPKELADYLKLLDKNKENYLRFFEWRRHFTVKKAHFYVEHMCRACDYLQKHKEYKTFQNLDKWFWE